MFEWPVALIALVLLIAYVGFLEPFVRRYVARVFLDGKALNNAQRRALLLVEGLFLAVFMTLERFEDWLSFGIVFGLFVLYVTIWGWWERKK